MHTRFPSLADAAYRTHQDDPSVILFEHRWQYRPAAAEITGQVDIDNRFKFLIAHFKAKRRVYSGNSRSGKQDIHLAKFLDTQCYRPVHFFGITHICLDPKRFPSALPNCMQDVIILMDIHENQLRPFSRISRCHRRANPASRASYKGYPIFEFHKLDLIL